MPKIQQEVTFDAPPAKVYAALMGAEQHAEFTGAPADINAKAGGAFSVYGGKVQGYTLELQSNVRIVQAWRSMAWPEGVYSLVRMNLLEDGGKTHLRLEHDALPDGAEAHIEQGWGQMYWEPLRKYLG